MRLLLDMHLIIWSSQGTDALPRLAFELMRDPQHQLFFSSVTIWEIALKQALRRRGFDADAAYIHAGLINLEYQEIPLKSEHTLALLDLPAIHTDPFDRILLAQAIFEDLTLLTADATLARYPGPILKV